MKLGKNLYCQRGEPFGIGATMHDMSLEGKRFIGDCGNGFRDIGNNKTERYIPEGNFLVGNHVDMIFITHAHQDHIGVMPRLVSEHPEAYVVIHEKTLEAAEIIFKDGLNRMVSEYNNSIREGLEPIEPTYDIEDIDFFFQNPKLVVIDDDTWIDFWPGWNIGFYRSGHDVGAMSVFIESPSGKKVVLTGDISSHYQEIAKGVMLPDDDFIGDFFEKGDVVLITEGTNASRSITTKKERKLYGCVEAINKAREKTKLRFISAVEEVAKRGGVLFIPAFAKQRALELAVTLVKFGFRVHLEGMAQKMALIEHPDVQSLIEEGMIVFIERGRKGSSHRSHIARKDDPCGHDFCIVISPSGTLQGGHAIEHAQNLLPGKKNALFFVGHIFEGSTAEKILNVRYGEDLVIKDSKGRKIPVNVRCEIQRFDMTAHDYQEALLERAVLYKAKKVLVHHCPSKEDYKVFEKKALELPSHPKVRYASHLKKIRL